MTIQIFGYVNFGGNESRTICEYYNNMQDAQLAWECILDMYNKPQIHGEITVYRNEADNVRPEKRYGASQSIHGTIIGNWNN